VKEACCAIGRQLAHFAKQLAQLAKKLAQLAKKLVWGQPPSAVRRAQLDLFPHPLQPPLACPISRVFCEAYPDPAEGLANAAACTTVEERRFSAA